MIRPLLLLALVAAAPPAAPPGQGVPDDAFPLLQVCAPIAPSDGPHIFDGQSDPAGDDA